MLTSPDTLLALKRQIANLRDLIEVENRLSEPDRDYLGRLQRNLDRALNRIYGPELRVETPDAGR